MNITAEYVRSRLDYDPETGVFTWKLQPGLASWNARYSGKVAGSSDRYGYLMIKLQGRRLLAHRLVWLHVYGEWPAELVDHVNRDKADNRLSNLRAASYAQNSANMTKRARNTSGLKGVSPVSGTAKWRARIKIERKSINLGTFSSKRDAHAAYVQAATRLYGEFATVA